MAHMAVTPSCCLGAVQRLVRDQVRVRKNIVVDVALDRLKQLNLVDDKVSSALVFSQGVANEECNAPKTSFMQ